MEQSDASLVTLSSPYAVEHVNNNDAQISSPSFPEIQTSPTLLVHVARTCSAHEERQHVRSFRPNSLFLESPSPSPSRTQATNPRVQNGQEQKAQLDTRFRSSIERQRWREANRKRRSRSDTMRDLIVYMDPTPVDPQTGVLGRFYQQLKTRILGDGACCLTCTASPLEHIGDKIIGRVMFERKARSKYDPVLQHWEPLEEEQVVQEPTVVFVMTAEQVWDSMTNESLMTSLKANEPRSTLGPLQRFVLVIGLDALFRRVRAKKNRTYAEMIRQRIEGNMTAQVQMPDDQTREHMEQRLLQLQLRHQCHVVRVTQAEEAVEWVYSIACDISIRPYKQLESESVYHKVNKAASSDGFSAYRAMLEEIPRCTSNASAAITAKYPTLASLMQAYKQASSTEQAADLLTNLICDGRHRRLGSQLSRRIHLAFTTYDAKASVE